MDHIRPCRDDQHDAILDIVNSAAEVHRGVVPAGRWHEPYMSHEVVLAHGDRGVVGR